MHIDIDNFVGKMDEEQTEEMLRTCLYEVTDDVLIQVLVDRLSGDDNEYLRDEIADRLGYEI